VNELPVPPHYQLAAEDVRSHLCLLRGGAPFLSPQDAWTLVTWLDAGVRVPDILLALERAAEARRKSRSRFPLTLGAAKRHLGKDHRAPDLRAPGPGEPPLGPLLDGVAGAEGLRDALSALRPGDEEAEVRAMAAIRVFLDERWRGLAADDRADLEARARTELGDLLHLVDEDLGRDLVEETARDLLRQRWPRLAAAAVRSSLSPPER
jgi:hypothetical protein